MVNLKPKKPTQSVETEKNEGEEETTAVRTVSIHTAKTVNLLAYLLSHPGIKGALLQLIGTRYEFMFSTMALFCSIWFWINHWV